MRRSIIPISLTFGLLIGGTNLLRGQGHTIAKAPEIQLSGQWRDSQGDKFTIEQTGQHVTLITTTKRVFAGDLVGDTMVLKHQLSYEETMPNLPAEVRQLSTGVEVEIRGTVSADRNTIEGKYVGKEPKWKEKDGQYTIESFDDVPSPRTLHRNGYHIASLKIDYNGWEITHPKLHNAVTDAKDALTRAQAAFAEMRKKLEAEFAVMQSKTSDLDQKEAVLDDAIKRATATAPPENSKSAAYKAAEASLHRLDARQTRLETLFADKDNMKHAPPSAVSALLQEYEDDKQKVVDLEAKLKSMRDAMGFTAEVDAAKKDAEVKYEIYFQAYKEAYKQRSNVDLAEHRAVLAGQLLDQRRDAYTRAVQEEQLFKEDGSPLVTSVRVGSYYDAVYWTPDEALRDLNPTISNLEDYLKELAERREQNRVEFMRARQSAAAASDRLYRGQIKSAIGQAAVESGFYFYDVIKAGRKGGIFGAGAEAVKKGIEGLIFGAPQFAEAEIAPEDINGILRQSGWSLFTNSPKRAGKTAVTGNWTGLVVANYLKEKKMAAFEASWRELMRDNPVEQRLREIDPTFSNRFSSEVGKYLAEERKDALEAGAKYVQARDSALFRDWGKELGKKFIIGLAKDVLKQRMKQNVANFFESEEYLDFIQADLESRAAALILVRDSSRYNDALDMHAYFLQIRAEILKQYDPNNHLQIRRNETFYSQAQLPIELEDRYDVQGGHAAARQVTVTLGERGADGQGAGQLRYTVGAYDLEQDADGGVKLVVKVER